ncbi:Col-cuticle-N domain-containing protein [Aphelenchoides fujianensis]|nr:Col-cuticle-N domain-containing protein [Aphelenchoides fujianensis]
MSASASDLRRSPSVSSVGHALSRKKSFNGSIDSQTTLLECARERAFKLVAFTAVGFSLLAVLAVCVTMPIVYNFVTHIQQQTKHELYLCKASARDIMSEVSRKRANGRNGPAFDSLVVAGGAKNGNRSRRYAEEDKSSGYSNGYGNTANVERNSGPCDSCCIPGHPGRPGPQGQNGKPGTPGAAGRPGAPGRPPIICEEIEIPPCNPCPPGPTGVPGSPGRNGPPGRPGSSGNPGPAGPTGPPGLAGTPGSDGEKGEPGRPAASTPPIPGETGAPGDQGPEGEIGPDGPPGRDGQPGSVGPDGPPGANGPQGPPGQPGPIGQPGAPGPQGERGVCPKYCALDGGIFFEDGTRR